MATNLGPQLSQYPDNAGVYGAHRLLYTNIRDQVAKHTGNRDPLTEQQVSDAFVAARADSLQDATEPEDRLIVRMLNGLYRRLTQAGLLPPRAEGAGDREMGANTIAGTLNIRDVLVRIGQSLDIPALTALGGGAQPVPPAALVQPIDDEPPALPIAVAPPVKGGKKGGGLFGINLFGWLAPLGQLIGLGGKPEAAVTVQPIDEEADAILEPVDPAIVQPDNGQFLLVGRAENCTNQILTEGNALSKRHMVAYIAGGRTMLRDGFATGNTPITIQQATSPGTPWKESKFGTMYVGADDQLYRLPSGSPTWLSGTNQTIRLGSNYYNLSPEGLSPVPSDQLPAFYQRLFGGLVNNPRHTLFTVGRDNDASLPVGDSRMSRQHAEFNRSATGWNVRDLESTNGTFVYRYLPASGTYSTDPETVGTSTPTELRPQDRIQIGRTTFTFQPNS